MRKATVAEQAARLRQRALDLQQKGMKDELVAVCKKRPELVPLLLQHAYALGADRAKPAGELVAPSPSSPPKDNDAKAMACVEDSPSAKVAHKRGEVSSTIPRCHQVWSTVLAQYLVHVMARAEPISLSSASLSQLSSKKSKYLPRPAMMELWEYLTNVGKDDEVLPWCRDVEQLVETVTLFNLSRGRPAAALKLPPQWHEEGVYALKHTDVGKLLLIKRTTSEEKEVPEHFTTTVKSISLVYIAKNYSEKDAVITDPEGFGRCSASLLFPIVAFMSRPSSSVHRDNDGNPAKKYKGVPCGPSGLDAASEGCDDEAADGEHSE